MMRIRSFLKREPVLAVSMLAAAVSCFFVPPDPAYLGYIDLRTLALLYALMVVVAGLRSAGVFETLAHALCDRLRSVRAVGAALVCLSFFTAMLITNDVALLTFVPFAVIVLGLAGRQDALLRVVVLQCVAANLGSMLTPVGNPQNLFLYSHYGIPFGEFVSLTFPVWACSLALVLLLCLTLPSAPIAALPEERPTLRKHSLALYAALFGVCLLTVVRVLSWPVMLLALFIALLAFDRPTLLRADFMLLLTFVCFFIFAGNLARIPAVSALLHSILDGREYAVSLLFCQVISNVPAALLLSGFTSNVPALLLGVNIGGLGTPIASLASLIGLKFYAHSKNPRMGRFLLEFTIVNAALLLALSALYALL